MSVETQVEQFIKNKESEFIEISHRIHERPELGNQEVFASGLLMQELTKYGFEIEQDIAGHQTGFIAEYHSNKPGPTIGFLAEYDALPGLGHACGHNIIGTTSVLAGIALKEVIDEVGGKVVVLGCPAEEGGENGSAKASYVKAGVIDQLDVALMLHPGNETYKTIHTLAVDVLDIKFYGRSAHASENANEAINALDAMISYFNGIAQLRQQIKKGERVHGVILNGGEAANIIPDFTHARFYTRSRTRKDLDFLTKRVGQIAQGAAIQTGCDYECKPIQNGVNEFILTPTLDELFAHYAKQYGEEVSEDDFGYGSTDTGNVSHVVPTLHAHIKIGPSNLVGHTYKFKEAAASEHGDSALIKGATILTRMALDLISNNELLREIKEQHVRKVKQASLREFRKHSEQPKVTLSDLYDEDIVYTSRPSYVSNPWLEPDEHQSNFLTGRELLIANKMPVIVHEASVSNKLKQLFDEVGKEVPKNVYKFHNQASYEHLLQSLTKEENKKIYFQYVHSEDLVSKEDYALNKDVFVALNNKARIPEWTNGKYLPKRQIVEVEEFEAAVRDWEFPFVLKPGDDLPTAGGYGVMICYNQEDLDQAIQRINKAVEETDTIIIEQKIEAIANYCVQFAYSDQLGLKYLGTTEQLTNKYGFYNGNQSVPVEEVPQAVIEAGREIMEIGVEKGFYGVGGFDLLYDKYGDVYAIDLNFRQNGSTSMLLLDDELSGANHKFYSYFADGDNTKFFRTIMKYVRQGKIYPLSYYDGDWYGKDKVNSRFACIWHGSTREEVEQNERAFLKELE
ncbi:amidohydrolase [Staphylococcus debuckii]|nr:amidohydrolase [Staphylococcus debuckii]